MKFNLKEINWALILTLFVVAVVATVVAQMLVKEKTDTIENIDGSTSTSSRTLAFSNPKKEETTPELIEEAA